MSDDHLCGDAGVAKWCLIFTCTGVQGWPSVLDVYLCGGAGVVFTSAGVAEVATLCLPELR